MNKVLNKPVSALGQQKIEWAKLAHSALQGERTALETLCQHLRRYTYNAALRLVLCPEEAEDLTQEVMIKVITNLGSFDEKKAAFTTWVYTILRNALFDMKPGRLEKVTQSFEEYGQALDDIPSREMGNLSPEEELLVKEANAGCMLGMLLCLERSQRLIYVLGDILGVDHQAGGAICEISPANFRQKLSRARRDLYNFMNNKCGLVNKSNPCRCSRKTRGFIEAGWVNSKNLQFANEHYQNKKIFSEEQADELCDFTQLYGDMFKALPQYDSDQKLVSVNELLEDEKVKNLFSLN